MTSIGKAALLALGIFGASGLTSATQSAVTVFGGDFAQACYQAAKVGSSGDANIADCDRALQDEPLVGRDLAGTYVNRGVVYMTRRLWDQAAGDFARALAIQPKLAEAWINRGSVEIALKQNRAGVDDITAGFALAPGEPEKAYYNRALGYEALGDVNAAYFDYLKAAQLKPGWTVPRDELARFTVQPR